MAKDWTQDETIKQLEIEIERKDAEIERLRKDNFKMWTILCDTPYGEIAHKAANENERLREENQKQREKIMLLNSMIQTEHEIIRVAALKEGE